MATTDASPFEIFRAGTHTATSGRSLAFSEADVAAIAAAYDPAVHEAPIVVGHPRDDAPAYGWVAGLQASAGALSARPQQLDAAFAELVAEGRFKKVSASFYAPDSPTNPKPGGWYLRHVGFLGAQPPAVKGLKAVAFAENEAGVVEFAETWSLGLVARLFSGLRDMLISQFGAEAADKALPRETIDTIATAEPPLPPAAPIAPTFAEGATPPPTTKEPKMPDATAEAAQAAAAALAAREAAIAAREAEFAERDRAARAAADASFVDGLVAAARLPKSLAPLAAGVLSRADAAEAVSFAEGAAAETAHAALRRLLGEMPARVEFGEVAGGASEVPEAGSSAESITRAAEAFLKSQADKGHHVSFREAVNAVSAAKEGAKA
jgi:hypothetical protein